MIDRKQLRAILDALEAGFVHIERSELDLVADTGLRDRTGGAVRVSSADGDNTVNGFVFEQRSLDSFGDCGRVAKA